MLAAGAATAAAAARTSPSAAAAADGAAATSRSCRRRRHIIAPRAAAAVALFVVLAIAAALMGVAAAAASASAASSIEVRQEPPQHHHVVRAEERAEERSAGGQGGAAAAAAAASAASNDDGHACVFPLAVDPSASPINLGGRVTKPIRATIKARDDDGAGAARVGGTTWVAVRLPPPPPPPPSPPSTNAAAAAADPEPEPTPACPTPEQLPQVLAASGAALVPPPTPSSPGIDTPGPVMADVVLWAVGRVAALTLERFAGEVSSKPGPVSAGVPFVFEARATRGTARIASKVLGDSELDLTDQKFSGTGCVLELAAAPAPSAPAAAATASAGAAPNDGASAQLVVRCDALELQADVDTGVVGAHLDITGALLARGDAAAALSGGRADDDGAAAHAAAVVVPWRQVARYFSAEGGSKLKVEQQPQRALDSDLAQSAEVEERPTRHHQRRRSRHRSRELLAVAAAAPPAAKPASPASSSKNQTAARCAAGWTGADCVVCPPASSSSSSKSSSSSCATFTGDPSSVCRDTFDFTRRGGPAYKAYTCAMEGPLSAMVKDITAVCNAAGKPLLPLFPADDGGAAAAKLSGGAKPSAKNNDPAWTAALAAHPLGMGPGATLPLVGELINATYPHTRVGAQAMPIPHDDANKQTGPWCQLRVAALVPPALAMDELMASGAPFPADVSTMLTVPLTCTGVDCTFTGGSAAFSCAFSSCTCPSLNPERVAAGEAPLFASCPRIVRQIASQLQEKSLAMECDRSTSKCLLVGTKPQLKARCRAAACASPSDVALAVPGPDYGGGAGAAAAGGQAAATAAASSSSSARGSAQSASPKGLLGRGGAGAGGGIGGGGFGGLSAGGQQQTGPVTLPPPALVPAVSAAPLGLLLLAALVGFAQIMALKPFLLAKGRHGSSKAGDGAAAGAHGGSGGRGGGAGAMVETNHSISGAGPSAYPLAEDSVQAAAAAGSAKEQQAAKRSSGGGLLSLLMLMPVGGGSKGGAAPADKAAEADAALAAAEAGGSDGGKTAAAGRTWNLSADATAVATIVAARSPDGDLPVASSPSCPSPPPPPPPPAASSDLLRLLPEERMGHEARFLFDDVSVYVPDRGFERRNPAATAAAADADNNTRDADAASGFAWAVWRRGPLAALRQRRAAAPSTATTPTPLTPAIGNGPKGYRPLLQGLTGACRAGEVLGILGPSGAGKTTALAALSCGAMEGLARGSRASGRVSLGGERRPSGLRKLSAFVAQDDVLMAQLTVEETVRLAAVLKLRPSSAAASSSPSPPSASRGADAAALASAALRERVDTVLEELGLAHVAGALVGAGGAAAAAGSGAARGLSGGERRRVTIATALVTQPRLVIMDEPTSGLDSHAAWSLLRLLEKVARGDGSAAAPGAPSVAALSPPSRRPPPAAGRGRVVVASLHQPSPDCFALLSRVLLLARGGRVAYMGPGGGAAAAAAARCGMPLPPGRPIAEHLLECVSSEPGATRLAEAAARERDAALMLEDMDAAAVEGAEAGGGASDGAADARNSPALPPHLQARPHAPSPLSAVAGAHAHHGVGTPPPGAASNLQHRPSLGGGNGAAGSSGGGGGGAAWSLRRSATGPPGLSAGGVNAPSPSRGSPVPSPSRHHHQLAAPPQAAGGVLGGAGGPTTSLPSLPPLRRRAPDGAADASGADDSPSANGRALTPLTPRGWPSFFFSSRSLGGRSYSGAGGECGNGGGGGAWTPVSSGGNSGPFAFFEHASSPDASPRRSRRRRGDGKSHNDNNTNNNNSSDPLSTSFSTCCGLVAAAIGARLSPARRALRAFAALQWRAFTCARRSPALLLLQCAVGLGLGLGVGLVFFRLDATNVGVQNRLGALFFALALFGFSSLTAVDAVVAERRLVGREVAARLYRPWAHTAALLSVDGLLLRALPALLFSALAYPLIGLNPRPERVATFFCVLASYSATVGALAIALASALGSAAATALALNILLLSWVLVGGYLTNARSMPAWVRWVRWASPLSYAFEILATNELAAGPRFSVDFEGLPTLEDVPGENFLRLLGLDPSRTALDAVLLAACFAVAAGAAFVAAEVRLRAR